MPKGIYDRSHLPPPKEKSMAFRLSNEEYIKLKKICKINNESITEFIRKSIEIRFEKVIESIIWIKK